MSGDRGSVVVPALVALATAAALALASCSPAGPAVGGGPLDRPTVYDRQAVAEEAATDR